VLLTQYFSGDQIENNEMGGTLALMRGSRGVYSVLVGKPEEKRPLGRPRLIWENNIKMDLQEVGCGDMDGIDQSQDKDRWSALLTSVMNLCFSISGEFLD